MKQRPHKGKSLAQGHIASDSGVPCMVVQEVHCTRASGRRRELGLKSSGVGEKGRPYERIGRTMRGKEEVPHLREPPLDSSLQGPVPKQAELCYPEGRGEGQSLDHCAYTGRASQ